MLVGRSSELGRIEALLAAARAGRAGALVVRGEPGIGKTSLLEWAAEHADGFRVVRAVGVESEAGLDCAGLHQVLRPLLGGLDDLPAPQAAALRAALALDDAAATERFAVFAGTLGLLAASAERTPLLCLVDDAQWLDEASGEALAFAARRLDAEPVVMLFAARTVERPFIAEAVPSIELEGLDDDASAMLLAACDRPLGAATAAVLVRLAAGNPLALMELPRSLDDDQLRGVAPLADPLAVTTIVEAAFVARIRVLSPDARWAILLLAAAGSSGVGAALASTRVTRGLFEAEAAGLVRRDAGAVSFGHPLVRAAAYQSASPAERRRAHEELAAALDGDAWAADARAWHLAAAAEQPDGAIATLLEEVADRAGRRGSMDARARALERAADLTVDPPLRARRLLGAGRAAFLAGHTPLAKRLIGTAADLAVDPVLRADISFARWDVKADPWDQLFPSLKRDAESIAELDPSRAARMLANAVNHAWELGRMEEVSLLIDRALELLDGRPLPGCIAVGSAQSWRRLAEGRIEDAVDAALQALAVGDETDSPDDLECLCNAAMALTFAEHGAARDAVGTLIDRARAAGTLPGLYLALCARSNLEEIEGQLPAAYAAAVEAFAIAELLGSCRAAVTAIRLAQVEAYLGQAEACRQHVTSAVALGNGDPWYAAGGQRVLGLLALSAGDLEGAEEALRPAVELQAVVGDPEHLTCLADHIEALLRLGRASEAVVNLRDLERQAGPSAPPRVVAAARRCRLLMTRDDGLDDAFAHAMAPLVGRSPFAQARTRLGYGERLRRAGRRVDARTSLRAALTTFEELGAEPWAEQARQQLRASGATLRRRDAGMAEVLTAQERQVASLVGDGRTNREVGAALFISPRTVELHLSRVYRKLGVPSRRELIRMRATGSTSLAMPPVPAAPRAVTPAV